MDLLAPQNNRRATRTKSKANLPKASRRALGNITNKENAGAASKKSKSSLVTKPPRRRSNRTSVTTLAPGPGIRQSKATNTTVTTRRTTTLMAPKTRPLRDRDVVEADVVPMDVDTIMDDDCGGANEVLLDPMDIDSIVSDEDEKDMDNPLLEAEYMGDIMNAWHTHEMDLVPLVNYMDTVQKDCDVRMREILVDWLVEVHLKFELRPDVIYLTVQLLDRFLSKKSVHRTKLQLVGCTAMWLASKYEEIFSPRISDFVYMTANAFDDKQFLTMESMMLSTLEFRLTRPTILNFAERYLHVTNATDKLKHTTLYLCELTLQKVDLIFERPSLVAAAAIYLARMLLQQTGWCSVLEKHSTYTQADVADTVHTIHRILNETSSKYKAVRRKYSSTKYNEVARINPGDLVVV